MKKLSLSLLLLAACLAPALSAALTPAKQTYEIRIVQQNCSTNDTMYYLGTHYRDQLRPIDSCVMHDGVLVFKGSPWLERGIYTIYREGNKKNPFDFTFDQTPSPKAKAKPSPNAKFVITVNEKWQVADPKKDIVGSEANQAMFTYLNRFNKAKEQARDIDKRKKSSDPQVKAAAEKEMEALQAEMDLLMKEYVKEHDYYLYFHLLDMFSGPNVPDEAEDKALYYRAHYWDGVDLSDRSLVNTPDLFNKMNYYFFGVLYHADSDTIIKYADNVLHSIEGDTLMLRYFLDFIAPRYYRSTKNIGWDAVWCHLARTYYLAGKCPWATAGDLYNKKMDLDRIEQSLIGAFGQELWMADTNQSNDPNDWISSHRFPQKYVILWFWDPDCHHCQEQTATLKILYDSLSAAGNKRFEVYAVGYEADVNKWKKYVRDHQLPFVNVGGSNVNIDYQVAYNVHGAPTMIILNERRQIIMNKVIPTNQIMPFLDRYEERQKKQ